jgi:transcriptional regulator with XRE-family HTH domain
MRKNLQNARQSKGMTQKQIADYLGVTERAYCYIETGQRGTSEENWLKLYEIFKESALLHDLIVQTK